MGLKQFNINIEDLCKDDSLRLRSPFVLPKIGYKYDKLNNYLEFVESGKRPNGGINSEDYGEAISIGGEQINIDGSVDLSKIPYVPNDYFDVCDKGKVTDNDILICKDGALTGKTCIINFSVFPSKKVMVNEHVYIFRANNKIYQKFLFYYTRNIIFQAQVKDLAYRKKAQPGLNLDHLKKIKIPAIPKNEQEKILKIVEPIEKRIKELKAKIKEPQEVINQALTREFNIDIVETQKEEKCKQFFVNSTVTFRNPNIRNSVRWHKIVPIQRVMYKNIECIKKLGDYIIFTKNGWSPNCRESDSLNLVFGVNSISKNGVVKYDDMKVSDEICQNIDTFYVKNNDFFVSRGNTVDLVALASVVESMPDEKDIIFPDLFIKVEFDENHINKKYIAYLFNSIIGRYYFKYSSKGKNQTMVKISSDEINGFFLPIPSLDLQQRIVDKIKAKMDVQETIKAEIEKEQFRIDSIIEKAIKNG